jgi:hypothetical protein
MNGDLSRVTFNPLNHFTSIVLQQGRVQMDADGNEQAAILLHYLRGLAADLIGQHGGPDDLFGNQAARTGLQERNCGFALVGASGTATAPDFSLNPELLESEKQALKKALGDGRLPLVITTGRYYVDGLRSENESARQYFEQPYLKRADDEEITRKANATYLLYLDVWERFVSATDDPSIREVALGGADTAARTKLIWQVRIAPEQIAAPPNTCTDFNLPWPAEMKKLFGANRGVMKAWTKGSEGTGDDEVCITSPEARFRGLENQLYRVEIHRGGPALGVTNREPAATFKWSRNNATTSVAVKEKNGDRLVVSGLRDLSRWFEVGNWVELTHDALELNGLPGTMVRLAKVEGEVLTIDPDTTSGTIYEPDSDFDDLRIRNLKVRLWDHKQPEARNADDENALQDGAIPVEEGVELDLEDGIKILFERDAAVPARYVSGDYWLIPARVATGDVEWPREEVEDTGENAKKDEAKLLPPHGVTHHYAPLAALTLAAGKVTKIVDLRHKFTPLAVCK